MEFGKLGGLGGLGSLGNLGNVGKLVGFGGGKNNFLIWAVLAIIVFGFGKGRAILGSNLFQMGKIPQDSRHSRRRYKGSAPPPPSPLGGLGALGGLGNIAGGGLGSMLAGNGLFILAVVALLFLCKDKKDEDHIDSYEDVAEPVED